MEFGLFDSEGDVHIRERNLPHWFQPGAATFITFRTADSLPLEACLRMQRELEAWLLSHDLPIGIARSRERDTSPEWKSLWNELSSVKAREYNKLRLRLFHRALDTGYGECLLREPEVAAIVADAILHSQGVKHDVDRLVIMPNHVHVLAQFRTGTTSRIVGQSWMRYSARQINSKLGRNGSFWQPEPFDHIVRSADQFAYLQWYIANNPIKAKLQESEYYYWQQT